MTRWPHSVWRPPRRFLVPFFDAPWGLVTFLCLVRTPQAPPPALFWSAQASWQLLAWTPVDEMVLYISPPELYARETSKVTPKRCLGIPLTFPERPRTLVRSCKPWPAVVRRCTGFTVGTHDVPPSVAIATTYVSKHHSRAAGLCDVAATGAFGTIAYRCRPGAYQ